MANEHFETIFFSTDKGSLSCVLIGQNAIFPFSGYSWRFDDHGFAFHNPVMFVYSGKRCCMGKYRRNFLQDYSELKNLAFLCFAHERLFIQYKFKIEENRSDNDFDSFLSPKLTCCVAYKCY